MTKHEQLKNYMADKPCGVRGKYIAGCRCDLCRRANTDYQNMRTRKKARGITNELVDASPAREHLRKLSKRGIGYKTVAEYSGVGRSTVFEIMKGTRTLTRRQTLEAVMKVDRGCFMGGTLRRAGQLWVNIKWLMEEGFTKTAIAKRLGYKSRALQFNRKRVTGKNLVKVERLVNQLRLGEEGYADND